MGHTLYDAGFMSTRKLNRKLPISQKPAFDNGKSGAETQ